MAKLIYLQNLSDRKHSNPLLMDMLNLDIKHGPWIAGGAAISLYTRQLINDIDVYVSDESQQQSAEAYLRAHQTITYESDNALSAKVTLGDTITHKVQIIRKGVYKSIIDVFDTFDFSICCIATDGAGNFVATPEALVALGSKRLKVINFVPDKFMARWAKYTMYGYSLPCEEFADYVSRIDSQQFANICNINDGY